MSIFGTPVADEVGGFNAGAYVSDPLNVPAGALVVFLAMYATGAAPIVSIVSSDLTDTVVVENALTDGATDYSWGFILAATANAAKLITATFTGSGGFGGLITWVVPITSGRACLFDVLPAIKAMSGTGNQTSTAFNTAGADEIGFCSLFDRNGVAGSAAWTAVSPAVLDSGNCLATRSAADHQTWTGAQTGATIGLANAGSPLGGITAIAFKAVPPPTHSISGNTGQADATVNLTGTATGTTTADGSGNYSFSGLADGPYTITPTLKGFKFKPLSLSETLAGSNITGVNFTAKRNAFGRSK
jgi:hypothetical protein